MTGNFYPSFSFITGITNEKNAVVTFLEDHEFTDGEYISFRVGKDYGMFEISNRRGKVLSKTSDTVTVDIDTTTWTSFVYQDPIVATPPVAVPAGSGVLPGEYVATVSLIDSFDDRP